MQAIQTESPAESVEVTESATTAPPARISLPVLRPARPKLLRPILATLKERAVDIINGDGTGLKSQITQTPRKVFKLLSAAFE